MSIVELYPFLNSGSFHILLKQKHRSNEWMNYKPNIEHIECWSIPYAYIVMMFKLKWMENEFNWKSGNFPNEISTLRSVDRTSTKWKCEEELKFISKSHKDIMWKTILIIPCVPLRTQ